MDHTQTVKQARGTRPPAGVPRRRLTGRPLRSPSSGWLAATLTTALVLAAAPVASAFQYAVAGGSGPVMSAGIGQLSAHGVTLFRSDAWWPSIQPNTPPAPYDFTTSDQDVATLAQAGLTWLPVADGTPWWQTGSMDAWMMPPSPQDYGSFVQALVVRYGPDGEFWQANPTIPYHPVQAVEIWNEQNSRAFMAPQDSTTPGRYDDLYQAARGAVHAVEPAVQVVFGGLSDTGTNYPVPWLRQMLESRPGALAGIDALGWHP
jgi:hypothetical protein